MIKKLLNILGILALCILSFIVGWYQAIVHLKANNWAIAQWMNSTEDEKRELVGAPQVNITGKFEEVKTKGKKK